MTQTERRRGFLPFETNAFDRVFISVVTGIAAFLLYLRFLEPHVALVGAGRRVVGAGSSSSSRRVDEELSPTDVRIEPACRRVRQRPALRATADRAVRRPRADGARPTTSPAVRFGHPAGLGVVDPAAFTVIKAQIILDA